MALTKNTVKKEKDSTDDSPENVMQQGKTPQKKLAKIITIICILIGIGIIAVCSVLVYIKNKEPDTTGTGVLIGKDGWLFEEYNNVNSELKDFQGTNLYTEAQLQQIAETLKNKTKLFYKTNTDFILTIVPNKMSIYSDKLKDDVQKTKGEKTKFQQVKEYLSENSRIQIVDLTDTFNKEKNTYDLYHNTDTMLNDIGSYYAYTEIMKKIGTLNVVKLKTAALEDFEISKITEQGKSLAVKIASEEKYKNNTLSMKYKGSVPYTDDELNYESMSATSISKDIRDSNKDFRYPNAIIYSNENIDSIKQFMSLSLGHAGFKKGFDTDSTLIGKIKPSIAVFMITEKELDSLLVDTSGETPLVLKDPNVSASPIITGTAFSQLERFAIAGIAEEGSTITATSDDENIEYYCNDGIFIFDIKVKSDTQLVTLTAKTKDKKESMLVEVPIDPNMNRDPKNTIVGKDGHLHIYDTLGDFLGNNLYDDKQLKNIKRRLEKQLDKVKELSPNTEIIYIIPPNHFTIYPETAPDNIAAQKVSENSRTKQLVEYFKDSTITILSPADYLISKKTDDQLLYQKTDTHWNELGAFYGYEYLMDFISEKFPAAKPLPLSDFDVFKKSVPGGDLLNFLGMNLDNARELSIFVRPKFDSILGIEKDFRMNFENIWFSDMREFKKDNAELPSMVMFRDSFSTNLMTFMAENFRKSTFYPMWGYTLDMDIIKQKQPDYVIVEMVERNLGNLG